MNETEDSTFLTRVIIENYRSIAFCDARLGPLTFLVGPNGSGKSNFLDALRFVSDALRTTLDHAIRERGGIDEVRRRSTGRPTHLGMRLEFRLPSGDQGHYAFRIAAKPHGSYEVQREECSLDTSDDSVSRRIGIGTLRSLGPWFAVESGHVSGKETQLPAATWNGLYLVRASGDSAFRPVFDSLSRMAFYNLNPDRMRELQAPDSGEILARDGSNITSVLRRMLTGESWLPHRIEEYLAAVTPGTTAVRVKSLGPRETLAFVDNGSPSRRSREFLAASVSDGTLRAYGVLVALLQGQNGAAPRPTLIGIEEPESALHPAAAGVLLDALRDASDTTQVIVTSHSADLLDTKEISDDVILAVVIGGDGTTLLSGLDRVTRSALRDRLYTAGALLRMNHLRPEIRDTERGTSPLFDMATR